MSAEDYIVCPNCGKENLIQATRCIYCKESLDLIPKAAAELAASEEDLSEMLSAMAEDEGSTEVVAPAENVGSLMPAPKPETTASEEGEGESEIPPWLAHIRQRAKTEGDAQGLYNRENESISGRKIPGRDSLDQPFNSWVGRIHEQRADGETPAAEATMAEKDEMPVWLKRVRDLQLQPDENLAQNPVGVDAWKQEWSEDDLERLKNGEFDEKINLQPSLLDQAAAISELAADDGASAVEKAGQTASEISSTDEPAEAKAEDAENLSPADEASLTSEASEEQAPDPKEAQAEILKEIVAAEALPQYKRPAEKKQKSDIWRWIGIIFLLAMLAAFYLLFLKRPAPAPLGNAAGLAFWNRIESVQNGAKVLMVLDYQAATADEVHANLQPVIAGLQAQNAQLSLVALWPDGLWLGRQLLEETALPLTTELSFLPGGSLAMLAGAAGFKPAGFDDAAQENLISGSFAVRENDLILYVSDNPESTKTWIEQVGTYLQAEQSLVVGTQASLVMLQPYYESGQIAGLSVSPYRADGSLAATDPAPAATPAFEAGMGVMAAFLAVSFLGKLLQTKKMNSNEESKI